MTVGAWLTLLVINVVNTYVVLFFFFLSGLKCQNGWCFDWQVQMCGIEFDLKEKEDFLETIILILLFMLCFGFVQCPWARVFVCHEQLITIPLPKLIKGAELLLTFWHGTIDCFTIVLPPPCSCHNCGVLELSMRAAQFTLTASIKFCCQCQYFTIVFRIVLFSFLLVILFCLVYLCCVYFFFFFCSNELHVFLLSASLLDIIFYC